MFDNLWADDVQILIHLGKRFHKNRCSFDLDANRHTHKQPILFHMTLPTVEGIIIILRCIIFILNKTEFENKMFSETVAIFSAEKNRFFSL